MDKISGGQSDRLRLAKMIQEANKKLKVEFLNGLYDVRSRLPMDHRMMVEALRGLQKDVWK